METVGPDQIFLRHAQPEFVAFCAKVAVRHVFHNLCVVVAEECILPTERFKEVRVRELAEELTADTPRLPSCCEDATAFEGQFLGIMPT